MCGTVACDTQINIEIKEWHMCSKDLLESLEQGNYDYLLAMMKE
jgi:hypothetical protein